MMRECFSAAGSGRLIKVKGKINVAKFWSLKEIYNMGEDLLSRQTVNLSTQQHEPK